MGKRSFWHCLQLSFTYTTISQISFNLFCSGDKRLLSEVDFRDIMNVSPNILALAKNKNFKNLRHGFVDERALITMTLISSCHWETLLPFCLRKKRAKNAFLALIVNYHKIAPKKNKKKNKQIMPSKATINWLFNDIWYSFIAWFDWKTGVFEQAVLRVYYILKCI